MKNYFIRLAARIDACNLRERGLMFGLSIIVFALLAHRIFLQAPLIEEQRLVVQMSKNQSEIGRLEAEIQNMSGQLPVDPDAAKNALLKKLGAEDAAATEAISNLRKSLVAPEQMLSMLETILARQGALHLVSLNKMPLQSLNPASVQGKKTEAVASPAATATPQPLAAPAVSADTVYKHGVEIVVQGTYFDLLNYLAGLEKMSGRVIWGKLELNVDAYPRSTMTFQLFTLSLEKKWMNL